MKENNELLWRGHRKSIDDDVKIFIRIYWEVLTYYFLLMKWKSMQKYPPTIKRIMVLQYHVGYSMQSQLDARIPGQVERKLIWQDCLRKQIDNNNNTLSRGLAFSITGKGFDFLASVTWTLLPFAMIHMVNHWIFFVNVYKYIPIYLYINAHNMFGNCKIIWIDEYIMKIFIHALFNFLRNCIYGTYKMKLTTESETIYSIKSYLCINEIIKWRTGKSLMDSN